MSKELKKLVAEERWRRWKGVDSLYKISESSDEATRAARPNSNRTKAASANVSFEEPYSEPPESSAREVLKNKYMVDDELTELGKNVLKANSIWSENLTYLLNFQAGKRLAQELGRKLASQTGMKPEVAEKISAAIMKQTLEALDELASKDMESSFPGVFDNTRS